jgi:hypothetical protein
MPGKPEIAPHLYRHAVALLVMLTAIGSFVCNSLLGPTSVERLELPLDAADPIGMSYELFVTKLNRARNREDVRVSHWVEPYRGSRVHWECVILETNEKNKWYVVGLDSGTEAKDRAFANFQKEEFDDLACEGDQKTIEGLLDRAYEEEDVDRFGIELYSCRFVSRAEGPTDYNP